MLQRDPRDRPCLEEVLQHPFCSDAVEEAMIAEQVLESRLHDDEAHNAALAALDDDEDDA